MLAERILELGWVERLRGSRALLIAADGERQIREELAVEVGR
ncbi:MAG TPA: hypothetical protein VIJ51_05620 [Solirubrobacteraceae bacterium]